MSEALLISNILLWIAVIALAVVVFALARQIGVLYERVAPAGALMVNQKLRAGDRAPQMALQSIDGTTVELGAVSAKGRSTLLFFLSPDCPVCKTLLPALTAAADVEHRWLDIVLASDGLTADVHRAFIGKYRLGRFAYVVSELLGRNYGVGKLPYGILIDESGVIAAMGIVNSREHLDSLFNAKEQQVASIQEYMGGRQEPSQFYDANSLNGPDKARVEKNV